uniref:N-acetylserotonin methyltransferase n=1 Tax=Hypericum kalmianum TaxID=473045 RepID=A0A224XGP2_9ROSI
MTSIPNLATQEMLKAQIHFYSHIMLYIKSMSLKCCIQLGIPDIIHKHGKPISLSELASSLAIQPTKIPCLYRLMQMLVHSGFFVSSEADNCQELTYDLTLSSRILVSDDPNCLSPMVVALLTPEFMSAFDCLADWFRGNENKTPFQHAHNINFWEYLFDDKNQEYKRQFSEGMACDSRMTNLVLGNCKPIFEGLRSVVDVGGGTGSLARAISDAFPDVKCKVLDLPQVVANLTGTENLDFVGGDMFHHVPSADAVILKLILHDWSDEECLKILGNCKKAITGERKGGKVIIIDIVIDEKKDEREATEAKLLFDMLMMGLLSGKERSEKEWEKLFMDASFSHYKITHLFGLKSLIELYP